LRAVTLLLAASAVLIVCVSLTICKVREDKQVSSNLSLSLQHSREIAQQNDADHDPEELPR
jgi:hypothetical protein